MQTCLVCIVCDHDPEDPRLVLSTKDESAMEADAAELIVRAFEVSRSLVFRRKEPGLYVHPVRVLPWLKQKAGSTFEVQIARPRLWILKLANVGS